MESLQSYYTTPAVSKRRRRPTTSGLAKGNQNAIVKRTVKYLGVCNDPTAYRSVIRVAGDPVIKTICNAALNVERGDVRLSQAQKKLFRQHRKQIGKLTSPKVGLPTKRRLLEQRGGAFFIPALIGAAISGLAGSLFGRKE